MTKTAAVFSSRLAPALKRYVDLKRALGRRFDDATRTLQLLDRFLQDQTIRYPDLNAAAFQAWCQTQEHLASGVRRGRMREVYNSASIASGPSPSASFLIPFCFRSLIKGCTLHHPR